jgi:DNA-binding HxlR family transcriptional regulator
MSDNNHLQSIADGLASRMRNLALSIDRLNRLESGSGDWLSEFNKGELADSAMAMTLRAMSTVSDSVNFSLLSLLASTESFSMRDLIQKSGIARLMLSERLNDLVQVGLAARLIDTDHVQITAAGADMAALINELAGNVSQNYRDKMQ